MDECVELWVRSLWVAMKVVDGASPNSKIQDDHFIAISQGFVFNLDRTVPAPALASSAMSIAPPSELEFSSLGIVSSDESASDLDELFASDPEFGFLS